LDSFPAPQRPDDVTPDPVPPPPVRAGGAPPDAAPPDDAQLPPGAWLARNGIYLVVAAGVLAFLYYRFGLAGMWSIFLVVIGLSLVIFVHELGHFTVAKWCDVYVQTFSIGFGPALPGCRWQWGETVYKIALLPLGGYVQMLGEGTDSDEDEGNPRSYKNKPVGQRMMIISAGVVMNVILAFICFIAVFMHGKERMAGVLGPVEPGGRAWEKGVPSGAVMTRVGSRVASPGRPIYFTDLLSVVVGSAWGEKIPFAYDVFPAGEPSARPEHHEVDIEPRKDATDERPVIGVLPAKSVELWPPQSSRVRPFPARAGSAASAARRAFPWHEGDVVVAATDPDHPDTLTELPRPGGDADGRRQYTAELSRRWYALAGKPMTLRIRRGGAGEPEEVKTEPAGFAFGDKVMATSDPANPDQVTALPPDPRNPGGKLGDHIEYVRRLRLLAGRFLVIRVRHDAEQHHEPAEEDLLLPPASHGTLGTRMVMGPVSGLREGSPAAKAGVERGDYLKEIDLKGAGDETKRFVLIENKPGEAVVDPMRLPDELRQWAEAHGDPAGGKAVKVVFVVQRKELNANKEEWPTRALPEADWDWRWRFDEEVPVGKAAPLAVPELGVAYPVQTTVEDVAAGSPAEGRLQKKDVLKAYRIKDLGAKPGEWTDGNWEELGADQGPQFFTTLQELDSPEVTLRVQRGDKVLEEAFTLAPDPTWPLEDRGLLFMADAREQVAGNPLQAVGMGVQETWYTISDVYLQLRGFLTGRISFKNAGGPIRIAVIAYSAASAGVWELVFFLGLISINLAVINFLPIPFLDGGHMVFLIYEKIRGKPARESVLAAATYAGLFLLLVVIIVVTYRDILWAWFKGG
jgi:regulator of sigma E protease